MKSIVTHELREQHAMRCVVSRQIKDHLLTTTHGVNLGQKTWEAWWGMRRKIWEVSASIEVKIANERC